MRSLLVEDDARVTRVLIRGLGPAFDLRVVTSAAGAIDALASGVTVDAAIIDVGLPEGPFAGLDVVRVARVRYASIPLIVVTGQLVENATPEILTAAARANALVLPKPVDMNVLIDVLRRSSETETTATFAKREYGLRGHALSILSWVEEGNELAGYARQANISPTTLKEYMRRMLRLTGEPSVKDLVIRIQRHRLRYRP